jgi:dTDP-4-amino-4,6-dideoxygalactose transaminase
LGGFDRVDLVHHREGSACLCQVLRVNPAADGDNVDRLRLALAREGYEVTRSYKPLRMSCSALTKGPPTSVLDSQWKNLLELPTEPSLRLGDLTRICDTVRKELAS